jgi:hypothetical protein
MLNTKKLSILFLFVLILFSCKQEKKEGLEEILAPDNNYSEIIRMPISSDGKLDTINIAKFQFETSHYDFGEVKEGKVLEKEFEFTNIGNIPLLITNATSTCGCTVPKFPQDPIEPGEKGTILVKFDTQNKRGFQTKPITLYANTFPNKTVLTLEAKVIP